MEKFYGVRDKKSGYWLGIYNVREAAMDAARGQIGFDEIVELCAVPERVDPVVEAVREDLHKRSQVGIRKYGTTLDENKASHRERLQHVYEEVLDAANYLKWTIMQIDEESK